MAASLLVVKSDKLIPPRPRSLLRVQKNCHGRRKTTPDIRPRSDINLRSLIIYEKLPADRPLINILDTFLRSTKIAPRLSSRARFPLYFHFIFIIFASLFRYHYSNNETP